MRLTVEQEMSIEAVLKEIAGERRRQNEKWGEQNHSVLEWIPILGEEVGEVNKAALETHFKYDGADSDYSSYRKELVQVAAVAVAMIECLDRHSGPLKYRTATPKDPVGERPKQFRATAIEYLHLGGETREVFSPPLAVIETAAFNALLLGFSHAQKTFCREWCVISGFNRHAPLCVAMTRDLDNILRPSGEAGSDGVPEAIEEKYNG